MRTRSQGFTLIEIAIVLVIIGLLLGGVLKGQELITGARVRNLISQQDGVKAAFFGFQDRYRALPGDYAAADTNIKCASGTCPVGDGNGRIDRPEEAILVWTHLSAAGFMNGSFEAASGTTDPADGNSPKNPYSVYLQLIYDDGYGNPNNPRPAKHNLKTGSQVPVEIIAEVDRKIDDGRPFSGSFQFSSYVPSTSTDPNAQPDAGYCVDGSGDGAPWNINGSQNNCGGASLF
jgi:prepilin-type N-terminal cleavage/methylation domain-containing protein